ncbi:MAG: FAD-dependent oxidoreductase, partial [Chloroflexota bacterium]
MKTIPFARRDVAVLRTVDAVVLGGSLAGVAAANELAGAGWKVALVEPRTYLGWEMSATLRPWLPVREDNEQAYAAAPLLQAFLEKHDLQPAGGELPVSLYDLKRFLEDRLLASGVEIFYGSVAIGRPRTADGRRRTTDSARWTEGLGAADENSYWATDGVVIANKSGRQMLRAGMVVDTQKSDFDNPGLLEKSDFSGAPIYARTLEFDGVGTLEGETLEVPNNLGLAGDQVRLHQGYRGAGHYLVECWIRAMPEEQPAVGSRRSAVVLEGFARRVTTRVAAYLMQNVDAFGEATFADASHEIYGPLSSRGIDDPLVACARGTELARDVLRGEWPGTEAPGELDSQEGGASSAQDVPDLEIRELPGPRAGKRYERARGEPAALPVIDEVDVLVVGGGTSGATAAMVAGRGGVSTALVEMNPGLGGTGTYGGVHSYWFGRRVGFAAEVTQLATDLHHELRQPPPEGPVPRWNIEAKSQALRQAVEEAGVKLYLNAMVIGTVVERDLTGFRNLSGQADAASLTAVKGVAVATREGAGVILARAVIDATGDGDVAAHAGAEATYGAARDHVVMWYSLAQFARPGRTRNNFTSMVDVGNVQDYTRAILAGRRRRRERDHDHGVYVATRESRHIRGEVELTLNDQLLQRRWRDVINVAFSNHDVKGHSKSDWVRLGLIPPNLEVEIPYRALLPVGLKNILVVGKAISASHDALPAIRMQADMENLGGAAAVAVLTAAANACHHDFDLRDVDVAALQEELVAAGVLPPEIVSRTLQPWRLEGEA